MNQIEGRDNGDIDGMNFEPQRINKFSSFIESEITTSEPDINLFYFINEALSRTTEEQNLRTYTKLALKSLKHNKINQIAQKSNIEEDIEQELISNIYNHPEFINSLKNNSTFHNFCKFITKVEKENKPLLDDILQKIFIQEQLKLNKRGKIVDHLAKNEEIITDEEIRISYKKHFKKCQQEIEQKTKQKLTEENYFN
jgi:hypothetical protein